MSTPSQPKPSNAASAAVQLDYAAGASIANGPVPALVGVGYALLAIADAIYEHAYSTASR